MKPTPLSTQETKKIWQDACENIKTQITPAFFSTFIEVSPLTRLEMVGSQKAIATITSTTAFHVISLKKNLYSHIKSALEQVTNLTVDVNFRVGNPTQSHNTKQKNSPRKSKSKTNQQPTPQHISKVFTPKEQDSSQESLSPTVNELFSSQTLQASLEDRSVASAKRIGLRLDYKFKTFAVSTSNEMAHAAASAVSKNLGTTYNPLFFYGGVGVGKTHLMHAVGHNILKKNPETNIIYCTGEEFTNEIVAAIQKKKAFTFKKKYRNTQILLIDDIQFIAGKNTIQEEFFHTFNALIKQNAQIILTSDRPPHEINLLENRLRSRFEAGLMIDIQQPSFELRTAILLIKSNASGMILPMELAQMIAAKVDSARKIEGIISRIKSEVELKNKKITTELIDKLLQSEVKKKRKIIRINPSKVIKIVANHYRVKQTAIKGRRRTKDLALARHVAMYLLRDELNLSLDEIGKWFSGRDHTSVMHASKKIGQLLLDDEILQQDVSALKMSLSGASS